MLSGFKTRALRNSKSAAATNIVAFCDKKNITNLTE
jgi:hypothetical protein